MPDPSSSSPSRRIAREAVREALARAALELTADRGFDAVTVDDLAAAGGVSKSTFLRYFATKEDALLVAVEEQGEAVVAALSDRPTTEDDWTALRRAFDVLIGAYRSDPEDSLAATRLVVGTPSLAARQRERQHAWRPAIRQALANRSGARPDDVAVAVRTAAALDCLNVALDGWLRSSGRDDLEQLLDRAFAALAGPA